MNILLSGGWGYGNLGDDAILSASLNLLRTKWPEAVITVTSYCPPLTQICGYEVKPSMHRVLFGDSAFKYLRTYRRSFDDTRLPSFPRRVYNRLARLSIFQYNADRAYRKSIGSDDYRHLESLFSQADVFVMAGGGYFNNWNESFIARIEELKLAAKYSIPSYIIGQTLADFTPERKSLIKRYIVAAKTIRVRDEFSKNELSRLGVSSSVLPDMALTLDYTGRSSVKDEILFIPAELQPQSRNAVIDAIIDFSKLTGMRVRVAVTRLYNRDVAEAKRLYSMFKANGIEAALSIPDNYSELVAMFDRAYIVVSRNLHGLILGYVSGCRGLICLNGDWKFRGFMSQIDASDYIVDDGKRDKEDILSLLRGVNEHGLDDKVRDEMREKVTEGYLSVFN